MLKVHPDNLIAKKIYENYGFKKQGIDARESVISFIIKIYKQ